MNKRNLTTLGILAVIAIALGGIGFALAQDTTSDELLCNGTGAQIGLMNGRGFWAQLTEEQATILAEQTQEMLAAGASHEEIMEMKAGLLAELGIDAPLWSGPHYGSQGGHGQMLRDGSGSGHQFGGRGQGGKGNGGMGKGNNGNCPYTN